MSPPTILSLSPSSVVQPAYERTGARLAPHTLTSPSARDAGEVMRAIRAADYVLGDWTGEIQLDRAALAAAARCRLVVQPTTGVDSIDVAAAAELGIPVANTPGANARSVAEWTVMAILACLKNVVLNHERMRRGEWRMVEAADEGIYELAGRTVGIVGFGQIGQAVARRLRPFEVQEISYADVVAADPATERELGARRAGVDELCERSDVVTVHVPLTSQTRHLIGARQLELLSPGVLVNTARGAVVDEDALYEAALHGALNAALDVFAEEPLTGEHRWRDVPNVLVSPHLAGSTVEARLNMVARALSTLDVALRGELPGNIVNTVTQLRTAGAERR